MKALQVVSCEGKGSGASGKTRTIVTSECVLSYNSFVFETCDMYIFEVKYKSMNCVPLTPNHTPWCECKWPSGGPKSVEGSSTSNDAQAGGGFALLWGRRESGLLGTEREGAAWLGTTPWPVHVNPVEDVSGREIEPGEDSAVSGMWPWESGWVLSEGEMWG